MNVDDAIGRIEEKLDNLSREIHENRVVSVGIQSTQAAQILNLQDRAEGLSQKIKHHTEEHWKFIVGTTGIVGAILAAAKAMGAQ